MTPITRFSSLAAPFDEPNVDTNQICPTRFNKIPRGPRFAQILFHDRRFDAEGREKPDFILNRAPYREAGILVADRNFGCGSSRETAVYALLAFGIRAVVASSFGDIFANNCFKNGLLPIILPNETCVELRGQLHDKVGAELHVDLESQVVRNVAGRTHPFDIHPLRKRSLLAGLDDLSLTESFSAEFAAFETGYRRDFPWLTPAGAAP